MLRNFPGIMNMIHILYKWSDLIPSKPLQHCFNFNLDNTIDFVSARILRKMSFKCELRNNMENSMMLGVPLIAYSCKLTFQTSENGFLRFDLQTSEI